MSNLPPPDPRLENWVPAGPDPSGLIVLLWIAVGCIVARALAGVLS